MNLFTKFQPHMTYTSYDTDIITVSRYMYCCFLLATVCTHDRFLFVVDFFQANNVLGSVFELFTIKESKAYAASQVI